MSLHKVKYLLIMVRHGMVAIGMGGSECMGWEKVSPDGLHALLRREKGK